MMKAIVFSEYGPPDVLQLAEVPKAIPKDDEALIRTRAATVVLGDCEMRAFEFPMWFWLPLRLYAGVRRPSTVKILGQELAGEIEAVGKDVTRFREGDLVFAATEAGFGAYAQYRCLHEDKLIAKTLGADVTGVDSTDKLDAVRSIGADHVRSHRMDAISWPTPSYTRCYAGSGPR